VSLAAVGQWIQSLGRLSPHQAFESAKPFPARTVPLSEEISKLSVNWQGGVTALKQAAILTKTPAKEGSGYRAPRVLCADTPVWLPRRTSG
jgi:hypothetical protein